MAELVQSASNVSSGEQKALALKEEGNALISACKYGLAAEKYTQAIALCPSATLYSNRAQAFIKMESYGLAIVDADEAIRLDPAFIKGYYRRGSANYALGIGNVEKLKAARKDFKTVLSIHPKDADALKKYQECDSKIKLAAFSAAIENDEDNVASKLANLDLESIAVASD